MPDDMVRSPNLATRCGLESLAQQAYLCQHAACKEAALRGVIGGGSCRQAKAQDDVHQRYRLS